MIKACIFDLDGTIADTVESIAHAVNRVLEHFGLVPRPVEAFNFYAGDGFDLAVERALKDAGDAELNYLQEGIRLGRAWFNEDPLYHVKPYPNMRETLTALREEVPIAVCSNKPHEAAIHVVESVYGPGFFNRIQGQTAEIPRKPSPIGALAIADALGARPEECLYFGDTNTDMQTGNAAGMFTVGVTWGFRQPCDGAARPAGGNLNAFSQKESGKIKRTEEKTRMGEYTEECINTFLMNQGQLFDEPVAENYDEAEAFLEDCFAVVADNLDDVRAYMEEEGMDVEEMSDAELEEQSEVFALPDGQYLIVMG